ncbi:MAG: carboxymuconolactone decarboxylase family protein [Acidobacteria bacterium]|nr:carboxymuconolactone decarboxylase family protein [Acidobacteriota bacterium]
MSNPEKPDGGTSTRKQPVDAGDAIQGSRLSPRDRGLALLDQLLGPEHARAARETWLALAPDFERYVVEFLSAQVWDRPHLELRVRSLCTISALSALGHHHALEVNVGIALNNGATREDIIEVLLHMAAYAGFPACWEGLTIADRVFKERGVT